MKTHHTLRQGLEIFRKKNSKYFSNQKYNSKGQTFINAHDAAHVVFGCDTSLYGEGVVKVWTTFGSDLGFWEVSAGYKEANALELSRAYSVAHVLQNIPRLLRSIPKIILRARNMSKPWPFYDYEAFLDKPLAEIRKEFNIVVV